MNEKRKERNRNRNEMKRKKGNNNIEVKHMLSISNDCIILPPACDGCYAIPTELMAVLLELSYF